MKSEEFNSRTFDCEITTGNRIVLPKRIVDEYYIAPRDTVVIIGKRAAGVGIISFSASMQRTGSIHVPREAIDFCGFKKGTTYKMKLVRILRSHRAHHTPAPPRES
jgi:hypothetical protein